MGVKLLARTESLFPGTPKLAVSTGKEHSPRMLFSNDFQCEEHAIGLVFWCSRDKLNIAKEILLSALGSYEAPYVQCNDIFSLQTFIPQRLGTCDSGTLQHTRSIGSEADRTASSYNLNYEEMDPAELYDDEEDDNDLDEEEEQDEEEETTDDSEGEYVCEMDTEDELEGRLHDVS